MRSTTAKTCGSCGEPFGCGAKLDGCWCVDVELAPAVAAELKAKYQDCLCPRCLQISVSTNIDREVVDPKKKI